MVDGKLVPLIDGTVDFSDLIHIATTHTISLSLNNSQKSRQSQSSIAYSISMNYTVDSLESPEVTPIKLETSLKEQTLQEGQVTNGTFSLSLLTFILKPFPF